MCVCTHADVPRQVWRAEGGLGSWRFPFPMCILWTELGLQAWRPSPSPTKPSHWPSFESFLKYYNSITFLWHFTNLYFLSVRKYWLFLAAKKICLNIYIRLVVISDPVSIQRRWWGKTVALESLKDKTGPVKNQCFSSMDSTKEKEIFYVGLYVQCLVLCYYRHLF